MVIELSDPTDPRWLLVTELPERVTVADLGDWRYGKPLLLAPEPPVAVYEQPDGAGTDWVRPSAYRRETTRGKN
jgi:hypothetical protein